MIDYRAGFNQISEFIRFIFTIYKIKNNHWVFLALHVCNQMLLFPDPSITIFIVVQVGEEIVNRIAMKKFGFSLEKFRSLVVCQYAYLLAKRDELNKLLQ